MLRRFSSPSRPPLQRREEAAGSERHSSPRDVNAVLVQLYPGVSKTTVAQEIDRWKHLSAVTEQQEEDYLTVSSFREDAETAWYVHGDPDRRLGRIIALIIYTLTMDKLRSIATLKLVGAPDRTIIGLIVQQALDSRHHRLWFRRRILSSSQELLPTRLVMEPFDIAVIFVFVVVIVACCASALSVRVAVKVDPASGAASG